MPPDIKRISNNNSCTSNSRSIKHFSKGVSAAGVANHLIFTVNAYNLLDQGGQLFLFTSPMGGDLCRKKKTASKNC
jgi:hypothetical protein